MTSLGIVIVGRNEGERLIRCLDSVLGSGHPVIYVDSGSTDGSLELARQRCGTAVELDPSSPFTAGRGRNEGFQKLLALHPNLELVQFVDGDCEVVAGWLDQGEQALRANPSVAALCGRVRELNRERSVYNRLCDLEWDQPAGETRACGGNAMMRVAAFRESGGFNTHLIAGEEPELCVRLRQRGWKIVRLAADMVRHDAAMTRFGQWWQRALRAGWAYAEGAFLHGQSPERHWVRENRSILFWGALLPATSLLASWPTSGWSLLLLAGYPVLTARIYRNARSRGITPRDARPLAFFTMLAKFPQAIGKIQFASMRSFGRRRRVVDWRVEN